MREWFANLAGPAYASAIMWTVAALLFLLVVLLLIKVVRSLTNGTFVSGGRNRKARLAVMDAAAVDNQRRLVLVRRDDVEHLILIGGPTDVVVEQNIGLVPPLAHAPADDMARNHPRQPPAPEPVASPPRQPVAQTNRQTSPETATAQSPSRPTAPAYPSPQPETQQRREPAVSAPNPVNNRMASSQSPRFTPAPAQPPEPPRTAPDAQNAPGQGSNSQEEPRQTDRRTIEAPRRAAPVVTTSALNARESREPDIDDDTAVASSPHEPTLPPRTDQNPSELDDTVLDELEVSLDQDIRARRTADPGDASLEDEMTKLLGELSNERR